MIYDIISLARDGKPRKNAIRPVGQAAKTPPSHGGNGGSIPPRVKKRTRALGALVLFSTRIERGIEPRRVSKQSGGLFARRGDQGSVNFRIFAKIDPRDRERFPLCRRRRMLGIRCLISHLIRVLRTHLPLKGKALDRRTQGAVTLVESNDINPHRGFMIYACGVLRGEERSAFLTPRTPPLSPFRRPVRFSARRERREAARRV